MSILSERPDGMGFYYGTYRAMRINVRPERRIIGGAYWRVYINGIRDHAEYEDRAAAEARGIALVDEVAEFLPEHIVGKPVERSTRHGKLPEDMNQQERDAIHAAIKRLEYLSEAFDCDELAECPMTATEMTLLGAIDEALDNLANSLRAKLRPTLAGGGRG